MEQPGNPRVGGMIYRVKGCKTIDLGEPAQPSRGGLSHIYNEGVQCYIIRTHIWELYNLTPSLNLSHFLMNLEG